MISRRRFLWLGATAGFTSAVPMLAFEDWGIWEFRISKERSKL